jgi:transposase InsO family protein
MSGDFQDEIECLGIEASPSFVREPEGNGVAERFIRTLKENLLMEWSGRAPYLTSDDAGRAL